MRLEMMFAALLAALITGGASAATHTISPWTLVLNGVEIDADVGDDVDWPSVVGHDVRYVPSLDGQDLDVVNDGAAICVDFAGSIRIDSGGAANVVLDEPGIFYYYCGVLFPDHCTSGMRVRVNVADAVPVPENVDARSWGKVKAKYQYGPEEE